MAWHRRKLPNLTQYHEESSRGGQTTCQPKGLWFWGQNFFTHVIFIKGQVRILLHLILFSCSICGRHMSVGLLNILFCVIVLFYHRLLVDFWLAYDLCKVLLRQSPLWARELCRISPPHFLVECRMRRLNQASFVLLYFALFAFF